MATLPLDIRKKILAVYDAGQHTRQEVADRFLVSLGMVKKLLSQRKATGDIAPRHHYSGNKPKITAAHRQRLVELVREQPDKTLEELRDAIGVDCTVPAIHYVLKAQDLSFKKRRSIPPNKTAPTSGSGAINGKKKPKR
jgi:transposase